LIRNRFPLSDHALPISRARDQQGRSIEEMEDDAAAMRDQRGQHVRASEESCTAECVLD